MSKEFPVLSFKERDRRWQLTREFLKKQDLECLLLFGLKGRERYEGYLAYDCVNGLLIFPIEGEPIYLTWAPNRLLRRLSGSMKDVEPWVEDLRVGLSGATIVATIQELGLDQARIGVVGIASRGPSEPEGFVSYKTWSEVLSQLPNTTFVEVSQSYAEVMLAKSDEEIELIRYACDVGEKACEAMLRATRPGVSEYEIYATIMYEIYRHGAATIEPHLIMSTGLDSVGWGQPMWTYRGGPPYIIQENDIVLAETFPTYGGIETQQQMAIALGEVSSVHRDLANVARSSYDAGLAALRPGNTFQQVCDAMEVPLKEAGCWHATPLIHSLGPLSWVGYWGVRMEQMPTIDKYKKGFERFKALTTIPDWLGRLELKPGMIFELEPDASMENHRINIGGTVLITDSGAEELNSISTEMRIV